jgi:TRAP-type C4-dicarboxylate transport system permease small subunit
MSNAPPDSSVPGPLDRAIERALGALSAIVLFVMMALTCVDVVGRYLLNRPVPGGLEMIEVLVAATVFAALPLVTLREGHVTVDLLDAVSPDWLLRVQHVLGNLLAAAVCGALAWQLWIRAGRMLGYGDTTAVLRIPLYPLTYSMSILVGLCALVYLFLALRRPGRRLGQV